MNDIIKIFPTGIMRKIFSDSFTDDQIDIFHNSKREKSLYNMHSEDTYILELSELKNIKDFCLQSVQDYFSRVIGTGDEVKPCITQSWLNWTNNGESHHEHCHGNSIVSGVFYISTEQEDSIDFLRKDIFPNVLIPKEWTILNSSKCRFFAEEKTLLLFPSNLMHEVVTREGSKTRISLAFNTFFKGTIGDRKMLNELIIE